MKFGRWSAGFPRLPDFSSILIWNGSGYTTYISDSGTASGWDDYTYAPLAGAPVLPVGKGFFLSPSSATTNTFAGTVAVNVGTSNKMVLPNAGVNYLVGCVVPYAGAITNGNATTGAGGPNLTLAGGLPDFSFAFNLDWLRLHYLHILILDHRPDGMIITMLR